MLRIFGDVDANTGHITAKHDVHISGSVSPGYEIKSGGSVFIGGKVEEGTQIHAQGNVIAAEGVFGSETKVVAFGNVETRCVQQSSILARGNISVGSHIVQAYLRSGSRIEVGTEEAGGTIAGGKVISSRSITAGRIGTSTGESTVVEIALELKLASRLKKMRSSVDFCNTNILRIFRTLGLGQLNPVEVRDLVQRTPPSKREHIQDMLEKLTSLVETRKKSLRLQKELEEQSAEFIERGHIEVSDQVFAGSQIRMGDEVLEIPQDLEASEFIFSGDGIQILPPETEDQDEVD